MSKKMNKIEEVREALLVAKESIEENIEELDRLEKEEEPVTLRIPYEAEREETITIPQSELYNVERGELRVKESDEVSRWCVTSRLTGPLAGKAFHLDEAFDWELGKDKESRLCLVPLKKDVKKDIIGCFEPR